MSEAGRSRLANALDHEYAAAIGLAGGVAGALVWSRLFPSTYFRATTSPLSWRSLSFLGVSTLHDFVVNALMAVFFFALGLELSRELRTGLLARGRRAIAPVLGAMGGMSATALGSVALGFVLHSSALRRGWGVPMATDVAFSLGVLAVAGRRIPPTVRVFLLTLAISDDVLSVTVLALVGAAHPRLYGLVALAATTVVGVAISRRWPRSDVATALFVALWLCFTWANVEPALAGVVGGVIASPLIASRRSLERNATRFSVGIVLPLFAFVAAGLHWSQLALSGGTGTIILATIVIRLVGKTGGITAGVAVARVIGFGVDSSITWPIVVVVSLLCAIGFTVPLLFATSLFGARSPLYGAFAVGLFTSSAIAAIVGGTLLYARRASD